MWVEMCLETVATTPPRFYVVLQGIYVCKRPSYQNTVNLDVRYVIIIHVHCDLL